jgi:hypothetical protein
MAVLLAVWVEISLLASLVLAAKLLGLELLLPGQFPRRHLVKQELVEAVKVLALLLALKPELALLA